MSAPFGKLVQAAVFSKDGLSIPLNQHNMKFTAEPKGLPSLVFPLFLFLFLDMLTTLGVATSMSGVPLFVILSAPVKKCSGWRFGSVTPAV
jgi:hypothetical protein